MPAKHLREQEAKFQVDSGSLPSLLSPTLSLNGYTVQTIGLHVQTDTYMDTPAYDLLRHGLALRVRDTGIGYEAGIKSIESKGRASKSNGDILDRMDITIPLSARANPFDPTTWPHEVEDQLAAFSVKLDDLRPLAVVRQQRQKSHLYSTASTKPLAEWSLDEVWIGKEIGDTVADVGAGIVENQHTDANALPTHFHELEIERLASGDESESPSIPEKDSAGKSEGEAADTAMGSLETGDRETSDTRADESKTNDESTFAELVTQVQEQFKLTPIHESKLVRALYTTLAQAHDNADSITPTMELEAACRLLLHQQLFQIILNEHGARAHKNEDSVHEMRVATRRARAAIQLCHNAFDTSTLAHYEKGLKRLGRALGAVRDLDIALANVRLFGQSQPENQPESQRKGIKRLRAELKNRRRRANKKLLVLLDSKKYRKFIVGFTVFCTTPSTTHAKTQSKRGAPLSNQVRHAVPSLILHAFERVRAYETIFTGDEIPTMEMFHALRIETKSLRYLLEFTQHLLGEAGESLGEQLRALQAQLGELNDASVEQERLHRWAKKMRKDAELGEAIATRLSQVSAHIHELSQAIPTHLHAFTSHANRQNLAEALARI
jgi:CHAD domain-containing protein